MVSVERGQAEAPTEFRLDIEPIPESVGYVFSGQGLSSRTILYQHAYALFGINNLAVRRNMQLMEDACGLNLLDYINRRDESVLRRTDVVQVLIHGLHLAVIELLEPVLSDPKQVAKVAGHSAGEIAAFVASGALSPEDSAKAVAQRGKSMHESSLDVKGGLVILPGISLEQIEDILVKTREVLREQGLGEEYIALALENGPGANVIGGTEKALALAEKIAIQIKGLRRTIKVDAEGPFHTEAMHKAADSFGSFFRQIPLQEARIPVVLNDGVETTDPETMREEHISRMTQFVNWQSAMEKFNRMERIVKIGPSGQVPGTGSLPRDRQISITDFLRRG